MHVYRTSDRVFKQKLGEEKEIISVSDPLASIPVYLRNPHYSDERFLKAQTIFLKKGFEAPLGICDIPTVDGALYRYSDRLLTGFPSKITDEAWEAADESGYHKDSAAYREVYLQSLFEDSGLELVHILAQVRWDNGYSLLVYGFILPNLVRLDKKA